MLQDIVRGIVQHACARVVAGALKEHLITDAVVQILARMDFIADIDAVLFGVVKDGRPSCSQFIERRLDQPRWALRPDFVVGRAALLARSASSLASAALLGASISTSRSTRIRPEPRCSPPWAVSMEPGATVGTPRRSRITRP